jgi:hypothetical protein
MLLLVCVLSVGHDHARSLLALIIYDPFKTFHVQSSLYLTLSRLLHKIGDNVLLQRAFQTMMKSFKIKS